MSKSATPPRPIDPQPCWVGGAVVRANVLVTDGWTSSDRRQLRLFASPDRGRGSELGVWGELLVINSASDPGALVDAWHAAIDDRFDFAAEGARLEVKTTTRSERVHKFALHQLMPVDGCVQHVVSITTDETDLGSSVADLVEQLREALVGKPDRQLKLLEQVAAVLGTDWPRMARHRFDSVAGKTSIRVLNSDAVPRVEPGPPAVLEVDLTIDVTNVPVVLDISSAGPLARLLQV